MSDNLTGISPAELARFRKQLKDFTTKKTKQLQDMTELIGIQTASEAKSNVPVYQGRLRASIRPIMSKNRLSVRVWTNVEYAPFVEFGTKSKVQIPAELSQLAAQFKQPGVGNFDEFLKDIKQWCRKKGIPEQAAFPIAMKLINVGQKPQPFLYPAFKKHRDKYVQALKQLFAK